MNPPSRPVRVRIAPSPTGNCHVGTARGALYNLLFARQSGGAFVLRIDDTDLKRSTPESEQGVFDGLRWLGLGWDEGPDIGGAYGPYRQSERVDGYRAAAQALLESGRAYHCFCTPEELARQRKAARAAGEPARYGGRCRTLSRAEARARLAAGARAAIRLRIEPRPIGYVDLIQGPIEQDGSLLGDPVIVRPNGLPTYNFATVIDDHAMEISHVLRGAEHISNTFVQLQVYQALGFEPPEFGHLGLLLNPDRSKISKRTGAVYIGQFRDQGYLPEAMINHLALSGWSPGTDQEIFSFDELLDQFSLERCSGTNAIYDREKLLWLNGHCIRSLPVEELAERVIPFLEREGLLDGRPERERLARIVALQQERLKTLAEAPEALAYFFRDPDPAGCVELLGRNRFARRHAPPELRAALATALDGLGKLELWTANALGGALDWLGEDLGWKRAELLMPVRIAVSGREATPGLFETLECLGKAPTLRRLEAVVARLPEG